MLADADVQAMPVLGQVVNAAALEPFTVIIPAYNEEAGITPVLDRLSEELSAAAGDTPFEILVVDDGSEDQTARAVESHGSENIRLLCHDVNRGYGAAIKTGVTVARYPWIVITDADGTYPSEAIPVLLREAASADMVVGARTAQKRAIPLIRRPAKWVLTRLASYLSRRNIPDLNSGLRVMRKSLVERYAHLLPDGFSLTTTITLALLSGGHKVKYVPISYFRRTGKSKIRPLADTLGFLMLILRTVVYFDPLRIFVPLSLIFILLSALVAGGSMFWLGDFMDVTTVLLFITGVHLLALGMLADAVSRKLR
jgi:glycosyltransferase involved in cell wall biosynthesis